MSTRKKAPAARKKKAVKKRAATTGSRSAAKGKTASAASKTGSVRKKKTKSSRKKTAARRKPAIEKAPVEKQPDAVSTQDSGSDILPSEGFVLLLDDTSDESDKDLAAGDKSQPEAEDGFIILLDEVDREPPKDADRRVDLGAEVSLDQLPALHRTLCGLLSDTQPIDIEASGLREVDAASVQLLAAFAARASALNVELRWSDPSPALREVATTLDLGERII